MFLRPHFQLEELTASIRLVAELPPPGRPEQGESMARQAANRRYQMAARMFLKFEEPAIKGEVNRL